MGRNERRLCTCRDECEGQQGAQCYDAWSADEARAKIEAERNAEMWAEFPDAPAPEAAVPDSDTVNLEASRRPSYRYEWGQRCCASPSTTRQSQWSGAIASSSALPGTGASK